MVEIRQMAPPIIFCVSPYISGCFENKLPPRLPPIFFLLKISKLRLRIHWQFRLRQFLEIAGNHFEERLHITSNLVAATWFRQSGCPKIAHVFTLATAIWLRQFEGNQKIKLQMNVFGLISCF
jgi:hypothetical protein